jgi:phage-related protein
VKEKFEVLFMEEAVTFLDALDRKSREKILYNIDRAKVTYDRGLFKKLTDDIWEFRTLFNKTHYRLFAFWDNDGQRALIIATHGLIKKTDKTPLLELEKVKRLRKEYFESKKI